MSVPEILMSTQPVMYETGYEDWPYAYAGSCFPVKWRDKLYIVSAFHCFENFDVKPESTLYPIPGSNTEFFGFCRTLRAKNNKSDDLKHFDHVALEVCSKTHSIEQISAVNAVDLSNESSVLSLGSNKIREVWLRGYLRDCPDHQIDYEKAKITQQAYVTNGLVSTRESLSGNCSILKVKIPTPEKYSPDGMSGSAVYSEDIFGNILLSGMVIEFNIYTEEYIVIDSTLIRELLCQENT
ncbi:hypothetical protein [uncultured Halopseudomonas sp.]|uniref:hypothetical protein n=1 Tax=uncultured Halopseudomonas sp. TaxID=2901193 RepID=UPI0030EF0149|tara:strand:+ start:3074 stop:3790 length:717 start_codon:yes stop_codon:yes gene_type:complete